MAYHDMNTMMTTREMVLALMAKPFIALGEFLSHGSYETSRMGPLASLQKLSDADLAKRGLTRAQAVQLALRSQF